MIFHFYAFCFIVEGFSYFVPFHPSELGFKLSLGRFLFSLFLPLFFILMLKNLKKIRVNVHLIIKILAVTSIIYVSFFWAFSYAILFQGLDMNVVGNLHASWIMMFVSMIIHVAVYIVIPYMLIQLDKERFKRVMASWLGMGLGVGLVAGYLDFLAAGFGLDLIARDMVDFVHVGVRWHGFFGEPRDAAVTLLVWWFLLCVFRTGYLETNNKVSTNLILFSTVVVAFILTFSASGLLGVAGGMSLYLIFSSSFKNRVYYLGAFIGGLSLYLVLVELQFFDDRIFKYSDAFFNVPIEEFTGSIPPLLVGQSHNIYPFLLFFERMIDDQLTMLFGSGFGSVILTNMELLRFRSEVAVPAGGLPIILNDFGLLGIGYLTWIFLSGRRGLLSAHLMKRDRLFLFFCLAFSASLFHKTPYFYFLIFFSLIYFRKDPVAK